MITSKLLFAARVLAAGLLTFAVNQSAMAVFTPSQVPLSLGGQVEPNIMFLLDDSGSMEWGYMPDEIKRNISRNDCTFHSRSGDDYFYRCSESYQHHLFSSAVNKIYFDPAVSYAPPPGFSQASFTAAKVDGYRSISAVIDLSNAFQMIFHRDAYTSGRKDYFYVGSGRAAFYYRQVAGCTDIFSDSCYVRESIAEADKQNFANWYSYYRTRLMAAKAGTGSAFDKQSGEIRLGYGAINRSGTVVEGVRRFEGTARSDFFQWLYGVSADGGTPLRKALGDAGEYFSRKDERGPWSSTPGQAGGEEYACRQSYTILTTDGYWNGPEASKPEAQANVDNANGPTIEGPDGKSYQYVPKSPFSDSQAHTLADVAMYYWNRDLHPDLGNRVPTDPANPAFWQHMVTFGVGLGVSGTIAPSTAFDAIKTGATINWPDPATSEPAKLDDLLHAGVNGRGGFFSAQDPLQFSNALSDTLSSIADRTGSNTAAIPNARRLDSNTLVYEAFYTSADWSGKLLAKKPTQTSAGIVFAEIWEAGAKLGTTTRQLYSHDGGAGTNRGVALGWSGLSTEMKAYFNDSQALFDYVMGSRGNEAPSGLKYRKRSSLLGDIVNSTIVIANKQDWGFHGRVPTPSSNQTYSQFVASKASRAPTLFVGANDGFLHAFNANTGAELFAYMPNGVLPNVKDLAGSDYKHRYYVDGKLHVRDAVLNNQWRSVLLGGLGAGGKTIFALDVTDTSAAGFGASKVLWEIKDDADLGHNFGEPLVGRMKDGKWVAIFGNGHGSTNDDSVLFIVDLETGAVSKVRAGSATGGLSSPSFVYAQDGSNIYVKDIYAGDLKGNLWKFNLESNGSGAGDFEVSLKSGNTPQPLYIAADAQGKRQPITVKPEIAYHPDGQSSGVVIYFGTGRMYTSGDTSDSSTQTFYGVWDKQTTHGSSIAFSGRSGLEARSILFEGVAFDRQVRVLDAPTSTSGIDWTTKRGWYLDLPSQGERVIFSPRILLNRLVIETAIPSADPCLGGGSGWTMVVDLATGGRLNYVLFDMNKDGKFDEKDMVLVGGQKLPISGIGSSDGIPTGSFDLIDSQKYWLCHGTGAGDCIPAANTLNIIEGRQSWNQIR
ncbi:MAG: pilus assembly protein [Pseudomonas sp.]